MAKQQKYVVFNIRHLESMIATAKKGSTNPNIKHRTVVLYFEGSGKKYPGQLRLKRKL